MTDNQKAQVCKKAIKAIDYIDKAIETIRKCEGKIERFERTFDTPEYHLSCSAIAFLADARGELVIIANRNQ